MKITETHRALAKANASVKKRMSAGAAAKLRAAGEKTAKDKEANAAFRRAFAAMDKSVQRITDVMSRIRQEGGFWQRRATKALANLSRGWKVESPHDLLFLGELTRDEEAASDAEFSSLYDVRRALIPETKTKPKTRRSLQYKQAQMAKRQVSMDLASPAP